MMSYFDKSITLNTISGLFFVQKTYAVVAFAALNKTTDSHNETLTRKTCQAEARGF